ncbi:lipopolysaccharide biosynthesis protein [Piscinibacter sakaiensis]|uniref:lipopolysaccharide biosynthesis protein n=1 Tax=Piscinibacter sakaiensis TaxID=1547922 RepID=UPI003AB0CB80
MTRYEGGVVSGFRRNVIRIASGAAISQAVLIGCTPLLTRLYGPEEFGALAVFTASHTVLTAIFTLKYDLAIILPASDSEAEHLTVTVLLLSTLLIIFLLLVLTVQFYLGGPKIPYYFFFLPVSTLLAAAISCIGQWCARSNNYTRLAQSQVIGAIANIAVAVFLGVSSGFLIGNLVIAYVVGLASVVLFMLVLHPRAWTRVFDQRIAVRVRQGLAKAREYSQFPKFVLPSSLAQILSVSAQPFLLQLFFSLKEVGYFAVATRFLMVPSVLIGSAVAESVSS